MGKPTKKKATKPKNQIEPEFKDRVLAETFDRIDNAGSFLAKRYDSLTASSKEILNAVGKCLGDGASKLYKPASLYLEGKAKVAVEAYRIEKIAEAEAKAELIETKVKGQQALMDSDLAEELAKRAKTRLVNQEIYRQANIEAIITESIQISETEHQDRNSSPIDKSWMWKFIENAQSVSDEQLRSLWARMLSSQADGGNIKPITLDAIRLFDTEIANDFKIVAILSRLYAYLIPSAHKSINVQNIEMLVDIGILRNKGAIPEIFRPDTISLHPGRPPLDYIDDLSSMTNKIEFYELTAAGKELSGSLYGLSASDDCETYDERNKFIDMIGLDVCLDYIDWLIIFYLSSAGLWSTVFHSDKNIIRTDDELRIERNEIEIFHRFDEVSGLQSCLEVHAEDKVFYWKDVQAFYELLKSRPRITVDNNRAENL